MRSKGKHKRRRNRSAHPDRGFRQNVRRTLGLESLESRWLLAADPAADFDQNGETELDDLIVWHQAFGVDDSGDADGDGDSDGIDFLLWQINRTNDVGSFADINVQGNSIDIADGDVTPDAADNTDFGAVDVGAMLTYSFLIENTGTADLTLTGPEPVSITGTDFTVIAQPTDLNLAPGASTSFEVQFNPTSEGLNQAALEILSDDPDENPYAFAIQGTGQPVSTGTGQIFISGTGSDFDSHIFQFERDETFVGAIVDSSTFFETIASDGNDLFIGGTLFQGVRQYATDGTDLGEFADTSVFANGGASRIEFDASGNLYAVSLSSGAEPVKFDATGAHTVTYSHVNLDNPEAIDADAEGNVWIVQSFGGASHLFKFAGDGTFQQELDISAQLDNAVDLAIDEANGKIYIADSVDASHSVKVFDIVAGSAVFGGAIATPGFEAAAGISFDPDSGNLLLTDFANSTSTATGFEMTPSGTIVHTFSDPSIDFAIDIVALPGATPAADINLQGNSLDIVNGDTTPDAADGTAFGSVAIGASLTSTFVIENTGTADLTLTGPEPVTVTGADYMVTEQPAALTLAPGASTSFVVQFQPTATGASQGTVEIASDDPDENPYTFALLGAGEAAATGDGQVFIVGSDPSVPDSHIFRFDRDGTADGQFHDSAVLSSITTDGTNLFVADFASSLIQEFAPDGTALGAFVDVSSLAGAGNNPVNVEFDEAGDFYVATENDFGFRYDASGNHLATFSHASLGSPNGIDADADGNVWIAEESPSRVFKFSATGAYLGDFALPEVVNVADLAIDEASAILYVTDEFSSDDIKSYDISSGVPVFDANISLASIQNPQGLSFDATSGNLLVTDLMGGTSVEASTTGAQVEIFALDPSMFLFDIVALPSTTPEADINLLGNGANIADGDTTPDAADGTFFGNIVTGASTTQTFVIENTGTAELALTGPEPVTVTGADFIVTAQPTELTLAPGASTSFVVQFQPTSTGFSQGTVEVASDDPDEGLYTFSLLGIGEEPAAGDGQVFIIDTGNFEIERFDRDGTADGQFATSAIMSSITTDGTSLYTTDFSSSQILQFAPDGTALGAFVDVSTVIGSGNSPYKIEFDAAGDFYVAAEFSFGIRYDASGSHLTTYSHASLSSPSGIDADADGNVWIVQDAPKQLFKFSASGTYLGDFALPDVVGVTDLAINEAASVLYIADEFGAGSAVKSYDISTGSPVFSAAIPTPSIDHTNGIAFDAASGNLLVSDFLDGNSIEMATDGTVVETFALSSFLSLFDIVALPSAPSSLAAIGYDQTPAGSDDAIEFADAAFAEYPDRDAVVSGATRGFAPPRAAVTNVAASSEVDDAHATESWLDEALLEAVFS